MAYFRTNSINETIKGAVYVVQGSKIRLKVNGLGPGNKPLIIKASPASVVDIKHETTGNPKIIRQEQSIVITGKAIGRTILHGYVGAENKALLGCTVNHTLTSCISPLPVEVKPHIELPNENTEAGAIARMLIAENITPDDRRFTTIEDSLKAMQWMRIVLENRIAFSHPHLLQVPSGAKSLLSLIKNKGVIEGFDSYPAIGQGQKNVINDSLKNANNGMHRKFLLYRGHVKNAIAVATGEKKGADPCPTKLYAWLTAGTSPPSSNFVKFITFGGQDFYTLTKKFIDDPLQIRKTNK